MQKRISCNLRDVSVDLDSGDLEWKKLPLESSEFSELRELAEPAVGRLRVDFFGRTQLCCFSGELALGSWNKSGLVPLKNEPEWGPTKDTFLSCLRPLKVNLFSISSCCFIIDLSNLSKKLPGPDSPKSLEALGGPFASISTIGRRSVGYGNSGGSWMPWRHLLRRWSFWKGFLSKKVDLVQFGSVEYLGRNWFDFRHDMGWRENERVGPRPRWWRRSSKRPPIKRNADMWI